MTNEEFYQRELEKKNAVIEKLTKQMVYKDKQISKLTNAIAKLSDSYEEIEDAYDDIAGLTEAIGEELFDCDGDCENCGFAGECDDSFEGCCDECDDDECDCCPPWLEDCDCDCGCCGEDDCGCEDESEDFECGLADYIMHVLFADMDEDVDCDKLFKITKHGDSVTFEQICGC